MKALKKHFLIFLFILLATSLASAQNEALGIPQESEEYNSYTSCISGCSTCELRCKDSALQSYAENNKETSLCDKLSNEELKTACTDNINSAIAISSKDQSKCSVIIDEELKSSCEFAIVLQKAKESNNAAACSSLPESKRQACLNSFNKDIAIKKQDSSRCEDLPSEEMKECMEEIGVSKINYSLLIGIFVGLLVLGGISALIYFLVKRKPKQEEAPLQFQQQKQPSQIAKETNMQPSQPQAGIDLNKIQEALKKVEK